MDRIAKLNELLVYNPHDSFIKHALALEYIKSGDETRAIGLFQEIIEREPGYVGSYYHLAKLLVKQQDLPGAGNIYKKGMEEAKKANDNKSFTELKAAYEEMND